MEIHVAFKASPSLIQRPGVSPSWVLGPFWVLPPPGKSICEHPHCRQNLAEDFELLRNLCFAFLHPHCPAEDACVPCKQSTTPGGGEPVLSIAASCCLPELSIYVPSRHNTVTGCQSNIQSSPQFNQYRTGWSGGTAKPYLRLLRSGCFEKGTDFPYGGYRLRGRSCHLYQCTGPIKLLHYSEHDLEASEPSVSTSAPDASPGPSGVQASV